MGGNEGASHGQVWLGKGGVGSQYETFAHIDDAKAARAYDASAVARDDLAQLRFALSTFGASLAESAGQNCDNRHTEPAAVLDRGNHGLSRREDEGVVGNLRQGGHRGPSALAQNHVSLGINGIDGSVE